FRRSLADQAFERRHIDRDLSRSRATYPRSEMMGGGWREPNACLSREIADFRLSRGCLSPRSLHSSPANLSRERSSPSGKARTASKARSFRPGTSTERPAARAWNPPNRASSKEVMPDMSAWDRFALADPEIELMPVFTIRATSTDHFLPGRYARRYGR